MNSPVFTWLIEDISNYLNKTDPFKLPLYSSSFHPNLLAHQNGIHQHNFQFFLEMQHHDSNGEPFLQMSLWNESLFELFDKLKILTQISIVDKDGQMCFSKSVVRLLNSKEPSCKLFNFISLIDLLNHADQLIIDNTLKLCYQMKNLPNLTIENLPITFHNSTLEESYSYNWSIETNSKNIYVDSKDYLICPDGKSHFSIRVYPNGRLNEDSTNHDYLSVYLYIISDELNLVNVQFKISLINAQGEKFNSVVFKTQIVKVECWGERNFIAHSILFDPKNKLISQDDKLTIICEVKTFREGIVHDQSSFRKYLENFNYDDDDDEFSILDDVMEECEDDDYF